ncbi:MAG: alcohol dehydrogenase catalytic domain-containing protein [Conexivisphaerales archaeon]
MVLRNYGEQLVLTEKEIPHAGKGEALVRIRACGVCATDVKITEGKGPRSRLPLVLGHEGAGEVVESGNDSTLRPGTRVVIHPHIYCGKCLNCIDGWENICLDVKGSLGMTLDGCLEEYIVIREANLVPFKSDISFEEAALAGGTVAVPVSAIRRLGSMLGKKTVVFGLGALGFNAIQALKAVGAEVIALGRKKEKLEKARMLGADYAIDTENEGWLEEVMASTGRVGADFVFDLAGSVAHVPELIRTLRRGGSLAIIGYSDDQISLPYQRIALDALKIIGSRSYTRNDLRLAVEMVETRRVRPLIDSTYPLEESNEAIDATRRSGLMGRVVVKV